MPKLTTARIRNMAPGDTLRDDIVQGLHLRAFENSKAFYLYYRTKQGRQRRPKLGGYPTLTVSLARAAARSILVEVAVGRDPSASTVTRDDKTPKEFFATRPKMRESVSMKLSQGDNTGIDTAWFQNRLDRNGTSTRDFAKFLNRDVSAVSRILNGKQWLPIRDVKLYAEYLGATKLEILERATGE